MRNSFVRFFVVIVLCGVATNLLAGPFRSQIIPQGTQIDITVPDGVFLHVRNFTQEGGTDRGVVTVTITGQTTSAVVLAATVIAVQSTAGTAGPTGTATPTPTPTPTPIPVPAASALEPINTVFIAGPATVTVSAPSDATAFITYKKEKE